MVRKAGKVGRQFAGCRSPGQPSFTPPSQMSVLLHSSSMTATAEPTSALPLPLYAAVAASISTLGPDKRCAMKVAALSLTVTSRGRWPSAQALREMDQAAAAAVNRVTFRIRTTLDL